PTGRIEAAEALADWPDSGFPALAQALASDKVYAVRTACAKAMALLVGATATDRAAALAVGLKDADARVREATVEALGSLSPDEPDTHAAVVERLSDEYHRMRGWAAEAAGKLLVREAKDRLEKMAASDPDGGAKAAAKTALERLAKK